MNEDFLFECQKLCPHNLSCFIALLAQTKLLAPKAQLLKNIEIKGEEAGHHFDTTVYQIKTMGNDHKSFLGRIACSDKP